MTLLPFPHPFDGRRPRAARGSALSLAIVMSVVLSGLLAALAWTAGVQSETTGALAKADQAFFAAESAMHRAAWLARHRALGDSDNRPPLTGTVNGYAYQVSWPQNAFTEAPITALASNDPASPTAGTVSYSLSQTLRASTSPVPGFYSDGNFDNKNTIINGDVATGGNYEISGNGTLNGDLYHAGDADDLDDDDLDDIWGVIYPAVSFPEINFTALKETLVDNNPNKKQGFPGDAEFNFNTVPGTSNKVIYVTGDLTNPVIKGEGTLYVKGKITFTTPNLKVGSPPTTSPVAAATRVNLVATENIKFSHSVSYFYGSIYTAKDIERAQLDLWGTIYAGGKIGSSSSGMSHFTMGDIPWFDPRGTTASTAATLTISTFKGPLP